MHEDDLEFVRRVLMFSEDETRRFYAMLREMVAVIGHNRNLSVEDIEDTVQDLYVKLVLDRKLELYAGKARLTTWLFQVVLRKILNRLRKNRMYLFDPNEIVLLLPTEPVNAERDKELKRRLYKAIEELSEKKRTVVELYLLGYKTKEIAKLLGVREKRVYKLFESAKRDLRKKISLN